MDKLVDELAVLREEVLADLLHLLGDRRGADRLSAATTATFRSDVPGGPSRSGQHRCWSIAHLAGQLRALAGRASLLAGVSMTFDEESELLYGVVAPHRSPTDYEPVLAELGDLLPGSGDLTSRYTAYVDRFVVPSEKIAVALDAAIAEARRRTVAEIDLPAGEGVELAYVGDRAWAAQNHYRGDARSQIVVNTDNPLQLDGILDLACHEGYPGHHVFGVVVERDLVRGKGWLEFTVTALHSPMALIAEGTAMLAVEVAFHGEERLAYEREVLCH